MKLTYISTSAIAVLLTISLACPAVAANRKVNVTNMTNYTIIEFYGSNSGSDSWEEDILGDEVLGPNDTVTINFDDASNYCIFDLRAVFEDGDEVIEEGFDACTTGELTFK
ncbi:hypothetical protein [Phaeovulum sp.]|uniref:hypothetical protein n=1 Tax=Phaeovulum sp. TaxID=2934796 RepID=UPI0039E27E3C